VWKRGGGGGVVEADAAYLHCMTSHDIVGVCACGGSVDPTYISTSQDRRLCHTAARAQGLAPCVWMRLLDMRGEGGGRVGVVR
jgi:hypothetical protein